MCKMKTIRDIDKRVDLISLILILSVSAVIAYGYFERVDWPNFEFRFELHNQIIAGTAESPYRYRILVPFIGEALTQGVSVFLPVKASFLLAYAIYDVLSISFLLTVLFFWLRTWFSRDQALIGVLFVAGTIPIALQDHYFQPWSLLEAGLFSAAFLAIHKKHYWLLASLVVLASLNRETSLFIPLAFLLTIDVRRFLTNMRNKHEWKPVLLFAGLLLIWAAIFWGLRYFLGSTSHIVSIEGLLAWNTTRRSLFLMFVNVLLFLGGFWIFALMGFGQAPRFIKRVALIVLPYLLTVAVWGVWYEVRLLMPLYPVLVPLGLSFLDLQERKTQQDLRV